MGASQWPALSVLTFTSRPSLHSTPHTDDDVTGVSASMNALWEINRHDTLNSRDNKTFGHAPAHPVST
jgi:hypothetical protein